METSPIQISHERLVQFELINQAHHQFVNDQQSRYFIYELNDNRWQDVAPDGETEYDLQSIKQETARLPIGILTIDKENSTFSFQGDLTVTQEDQELIFQSIKQKL